MISENRLQDIEKNLLEIKMLLENHLHSHEIEFSQFTRIRLPIILAITQFLASGIIAYVTLKWAK